MIFLLVLAICVVWMTIRFSRPTNQNSTIYYHLSEDQFCAGPHKWKTFRSLFDANTCQELESNLGSKPHGNVVIGMLKHGLFCMQCNFVSGSDGRAVNTDEFVSTLTKALEDCKRNPVEEVT